MVTVSPARSRRTAPLTALSTPKLPDRFITARPDGLGAALRQARDGAGDHVDLLLGTGRLDAPPVPPDLAIPWLARECVELTRDEYDAIVVVTGKEGVSKSMGALLLCLAICDYAGREWRWDDLCYTGRSVLAAYERAEESEPIWYDEGSRDLLAGDTFDADQEALTRGLTLLREKRAILVISIPSIFLLAKKVRARRSTFWVHMESRGTRRRPGPSEGVVHERDERLRYKNDDYLGLQVSRRCPRIRYDPLPVDDPRFVEYQSTKRRELDAWLRETQAMLAEKDLAARTKAAEVRKKAEKLGVRFVGGKAPTGK